MSIVRQTLWLSLLGALLLLTACDKEVEPGSTDETLFNFTKEDVSGYTWYKNSDAILEQGNTSGHSQPKLRTRYNATAAAMLTLEGKVKDGAVFAENSVILKELFNKNNELDAYTLMWKKPGHADADADGWVWGTFSTDGSVEKSAADKGKGCTGCHQNSGNIDRTLMNLDHP